MKDESKTIVPSIFAAGMQKLRAKRAIFSFCREYHDPPVPSEKPGGWYCAAHNAARREKVGVRMRHLRAGRRAQGLCPECGQVKSIGTCDPCLEKKRNRRNRN